MRYYRNLTMVLVLTFLPMMAWAGQCKGRFPNPITDYCWSCVFPLTLAGVRVHVNQQEDISNPGGAICACGAPTPKIGVPVGFWEPARQVDITRTPGCLVSIGGVHLSLPFNAPMPSQSAKYQGATYTSKKSFYHVNWYINPILVVIGAILDSDCLERKGFDLAYTTALDPLWSDDELLSIINWDAALFANPIAQGACAGDCVAATAGFPLNQLFWCAGCQGGLYPLNGIVTAHQGGVAASALLVQKMTAKLHREGLMWGTWGSEGLCGNYPQVLMNKQAYKMTMIYPIPQTAKIDGRCCQPYGRATALWGAGKEFPIEGEDFSYMIYRKRNCCQGAAKIN